MTLENVSIITKLCTQALEYTTKYRQWAEKTIEALPSPEEKKWVGGRKGYISLRSLEAVEYPDCWYAFEDCYMSRVFGRIANYKLRELEPANCLIDSANLLKRLGHIETKLKEELNQKTPSPAGEGEKTATGTPGAGGGNKPAHQWRLAVKGTEQKRETSQGLKSSLITLKEVLYIVGAIASIVALWFSLPNYVKDFVKEAFPAIPKDPKDVLYLVVFIAFQILGLLAAVATLIMFIGWLRNKR